MSERVLERQLSGVQQSYCETAEILEGDGTEPGTGNQKLKGAEIRLVSCFVTEVLPKSNPSTQTLQEIYFKRIQNRHCTINADNLFINTKEERSSF